MKKILAFIFIVSSLSLSAQLNPKDIYVNAKVDVPHVFEIISQGYAPNVTVFPSSYDTLSWDPLGGSNYEFTFVGAPGFTGDTKLTIEYFQAGPFPGLFLPNYTTIHYRIKDSKIDLETDQLLIDGNATVEIDVLGNDTSTDGDLDLLKIGYTTGGSASINNNKISFVPDPSADEAYVRYFAGDSTGNIEGATLNLVFENDQLTDQRTVFLDKLSDVPLVLNSVGFGLDLSPVHGSVTSNGHIWTYSPNAGYTGSDTLSFSSANGGLIEYSVQVLNKTDNTSFVRDDQIFVVTNGSVTFDVFANDFRDEFNIIEHSPELTYQGNGIFDFSPDADFTGDLNFYYKIYAGFQFHTGNILIHVDDYAPSQDYAYDFTMLNNHDFVINHEAPISDYYFSLVVPPSHGTVLVLDNNETEVLECDVIQGSNTIIYTPDADFSGFEEFDIEFCTTSGICEIIKIDMDVLSSSYEDCLCLQNCVFEGDNNDDGVVNIKDVLDLALNIGEGGSERTNDFDLFWTGQESSDWGHDQMASNTDLKCGDADGDGYIDHSDFDQLEENYGKVHSLVPNSVGNLSDVPISFVPHSTDVDSGEWMFIDIVIGNASNPALDFYGTAFTFNINPDVIDSSSVNFVLKEYNWLSYQSPLYDFFTVPQDGQIDIAVSRINNNSTDGIGIIGTLEFIVEDEVEGVKSTQLLSSLQQITMRNIISVNEKGDFYRHPNQTKEIKVAVENEPKEDIVLADLIDVYPNPTSDYINVVSQKFSIDKIEVYDALGRFVITQSHSKDYQAYVNLSTLNQGVYFVKIYSNGSVTTKKVQKINR